MNVMNLFIYNWHCEDEDDEDTGDCRTNIRIYGLDGNDKSVCLEIQDFTPYFFVELPGHIAWNDRHCRLLSDKIEELCYDKKPQKISLLYRKKLYFFNREQRFPFLLLSFDNNVRRKQCFYRLQKKKISLYSDVITLLCHEHEASPILQMCSLCNIPTTGWVRIGSYRPSTNPKTLCDHEYRTGYRQLMVVPNDDPLWLVQPEPRIMCMDIEVNSTNVNKMPSSDKIGDEIFQISCVFSYKRQHEKHILTLGSLLPELFGEDVVIHSFENERELLLGYQRLILEKNPHIIAGYNIFGFDYRYMMDRAKMYFIYNQFNQQGFVRDKSCPEKTIEWSSSAYKNQSFVFLDLEGRLLIDLLVVIRRDYKFNNYKLKTVSEFFLGQTKDPLTPRDIFRFYRRGRTQDTLGRRLMTVVARYCVQDSFLVSRLIEVLQLWIGLCEMAKACNVPMFFLFTQGQQIRVYSQVYKKCLHDQIVVQSSQSVDLPVFEQFSGAYVFPPQPGIYNNIIPFDFTSLYPTTIIAYNIDYSTLVTDDSIPDKDCHIIEWKECVNCEHDPDRNPRGKTVCQSYRFRFIREPQGVLPSLLQNLLEQRNLTKKQMKTLDKQETLYTVLDKRQLAYKVSANSMYGAMGVKRGYIPFMIGAMCTTAKGRQSIEKAADFVIQKFRGQLVYGDTDSIYCHFPFLEQKDFHDMYRFARRLEDEFLSLFPKPMKLLFEDKIYYKFLILTKKRYMALTSNEQGEIDSEMTIRGVLLARRDNCALVRKVYKELITHIMDSFSLEEIMIFLAEHVSRILSHSFPASLFVITKTVGNTQDYKVRPLPDDPKKRLKRLSDLGIDPGLFRCDGSPCSCEGCLLYDLRSKPAHIQLAERMRRRGTPVESGSRMEYVVIRNDQTTKLMDRLEDPVYQKAHAQMVPIDFLYYVQSLVQPIDQVLSVCFRREKIMRSLYKQGLHKRNVLTDLKRLFRPNLVWSM